jgi:glycosyl-4,4'-diaponeurosporenoate acyltransferase
MQIIELSNTLTVIVDILAWFIIHMSIAFLATRLPLSLFNERFLLFRTFSWEREGEVYERLFRVKRWKRILPDGASWFKGGFRKKRVAARDPAYFGRFVKETCRGEATHWTVIFTSPLFFLFNPLWAGFIMIGYAVAANAPCIIAQRYNRPHLRKLAERKSRKTGRDTRDRQ